VPFLRLTRDRRGYEHTFLLHADRAGQKPRVLYWYRTAPDVLIGRPALDEDAIRGIEEQHPLIEFDWPAILALREAMPPEDEAPPVRPVRRGRPPRREPPSRAATDAYTPRVAIPDAEAAAAAQDATPEPQPFDESPTTHGLLEELVGREIATRLRARHAEILARIHEQGFDDAITAQWTERAESLDPDTWLTPDAILDGVRDADRRFEALRTALLSAR
jgi:hypothetical protein